MRERTRGKAQKCMEIVSQASTTPFLVKLWAMLSEENNCQAIAWDDAGDSFEVKSPQLMSKKVLPQHFRHNNFSSFQRQLNYFGFKKIGKGEFGCVYQHENFRRGFPELVLRIRRKTNSEHKNSVTGTSSTSDRKRSQPKRVVAAKANVARRQSSRKRSAPAQEDNPYAKHGPAYSYSPTTWTTNKDRISDEVAEPVITDSSPAGDSFGARRSTRKRMRLQNGGQTTSDASRIKAESNPSRRRGRSSSQQYMVTDITNVSIMSQQEGLPANSATSVHSDNTALGSDCVSFDSPSLMNIAGFGLDTEMENLMGYNLYSPAPPPSIPVHSVLADSPNHSPRKASGSRGINPRRSASGPPVSVTAAPVPAPPAQPLIPVLPQQQLQGVAVCSSSRTASSSGMSASSATTGSIISESQHKVLQHVQANSIVPIAVPVPVRLPRSRSNSVECPQGPSANLSQSTPAHAVADAASSSSNDGGQAFGRTTAAADAGLPPTVPPPGRKLAVTATVMSERSKSAGTSASANMSAQMSVQMQAAQIRAQMQVQVQQAQMLARAHLQQQQQQQGRRLSRQHLKTMRWYNHDPCLPPVSPFMGGGSPRST